MDNFPDFCTNDLVKYEKLIEKNEKDQEGKTLKLS
jgi:hypothetical protein